MASNLGYSEILTLTIEQLAGHPRGQHDELLGHVIEAARKKGLLPSGSFDPMGGISVNNPGYGVSYELRERLSELVRQAMWDCLLQRRLIFGMDEANPTWPFYRVWVSS